ncbi:conserved hypothetical protein [Ricinus communis]|uniref:Uncharacterized protein n=1 Tax=Ricinus communis TaxID=3988 RepID=B9SDT4_RICCO|nr:conserved hypothetical protein [Ricinus communis]
MFFLVGPTQPVIVVFRRARIAFPAKGYSWFDLARSNHYRPYQHCFGPHDLERPLWQLFFTGFQHKGKSKSNPRNPPSPRQRTDPFSVYAGIGLMSIPTITVPMNSHSLLTVIRFQKMLQKDKLRWHRESTLN